MKEFKNKWLDELESVMTDLEQDVIDAPIVVGERERRTKKSFAKWSYAVAVSVFAVLIAVVVSIYFATKNVGKNPPVASSGYVAVLEVNPKVMFTVDDGGKVVTVTALNDDADIVLSTPERLSKIVNKSVSESINSFLTYCEQLGFIDVNGQDAVKLSHTATGEKIDGLVKGVEEFFKAEGVFAVVLSSQTTLADISTKYGFEESQSVDGLIAEVKNLPTLFSERKVVNMTLEEIQKIYQDTVILGDMQDYLKEQLSYGIKSGEAIVELYEINSQIESHPDNPLKLFGAFVRGYWAITSNPHVSVGLTKELSSLIDLMSSKLEDFKQEYGVELDFNSLTFSYLLYISIGENELAELENLLNSFTDERYLSALPMLKGFLLDGNSSFGDFDVLPLNEREFLEKTQSYLNGMFNAYAESNKTAYETTRDAISSESYQDFVNGIILDYGSLENYWNSLQEE